MIRERRTTKSMRYRMGAKLRAALWDLRRLRSAAGEEHIRRAAWRVGHHAGRLLAARMGDA